ncbi:DUF5047 domain-containing protein [Streptomyces sp. NPDC048211]|uniref:DUF5047 domain-containing protein n=1 Tax=Streptomyces sp. NPDC048211 TaxID=3365516 RepID=UPI003719D76E
MEAATARFLSRIRASHQVVSYIDVQGPNQDAFRLTATGGNVAVDRTAAIRRRCVASCVDPDGTLTPRSAEDLLTPYGTEIRPYRGIRYDDGTEEVMPLGVFRISKATVTDSVGGSPDIQLEAYDRSRTVSRDKFTSPYSIPVGTNVVQAIKDILARTFPALTYDSITSALSTSAPMLYDVNDDPWDMACQLAVSLGCELFFDTRGAVVIAPPVDIDALPAPAFTYIEGPGCTMLDLSSVFTDEPGYNGVVLIGESVGDELPPVRSIVWDDQPTSATYHLGPYGEVPMTVTDPIVKTQSEADTAAAGLLRGQLGFSSQLSLTASVNPALDAGDVVQVVRARSGVSGLYAVDTLTVPLEVTGTQPIGLRQKRVVS